MTRFWKQVEGDTAAGKFTLKRCIGYAERSAVYETEYGEDERIPAAIKLMAVKSSLRDAQLSYWKQSERLSHPNIIRTLESGTCQLRGKELLYLVMERADDGLARVLKDRPLTGEEAQDLLLALLKPLSYLHGQGFLHGAVKPTNVLAAGERVKLSSDNIRWMHEENRLPHGGGVYAAPETKAGVLSADADAWSLGLLLIASLTQKQPGADYKPEAAPGGGVTPILRGLTAPFKEIVENTLRQQPQQRWTVDQIRASLRGEAVPERPPAAAVRTPAGEPVAATAAAAAATAAGGRAASARLPPPAARPAEPESGDAELDLSRFAPAEEGFWSRGKVAAVAVVLLAAIAWFLTRGPSEAPATATVAPPEEQAAAVEAPSEPAPEPSTAAGPTGEAASKPSPTRKSATAAAGAGETSAAAKAPDRPAPTPAAAGGAAASAAPGWRVISYTYVTEADAQRQVERVEQRWPQFDASVYQTESHYWVVLGEALSQQEAFDLAQRAREAGLPRDTYAARVSR